MPAFDTVTVMVCDGASLSNGSTATTRYETREPGVAVVSRYVTDGREKNDESAVTEPTTCPSRSTRYVRVSLSLS